MASGFSFGGVSTLVPAVRAVIDDRSMIPTGSGSTRVVVLLGTAEGGEPGKPEFFNSSDQARSRVRGGDIYKALQHVFAPSPVSLGASVVCLVRVNPATKSTKTLLDGSAGNSIVLSSGNWGLRDNGITIKIETGSSNGKKITITQTQANAALAPIVIPRDNLYREAFAIQYVGAGSAATVTIDGDNLATTITGGPGGENLNIDFNAYPTLRQVVDVIDAHAAYTCTLKSPNPADPTLNGLDFVTGVSILSSPLTVQNTLNEIVRWLNSETQGIVTATRASGAGLVPANIATTYFAGGSEGTATSTEWQAALDALTALDVSFIVPLTGDAAIHDKTRAHVAEMSQDALRQRRAVLGAAAGEYTSDLSNYRARAAGLNTDRALLVPMGLKTRDEDGNAVVLAPFFTAALLAGMRAGMPEVGTALTNKAVSVNDLEWTPTRAQLELGIRYGLCMIGSVDGRGGFSVVRDISTWLANDAYHRVENSTGDSLDEVVRVVVSALNVFKGEKSSPLTAYQIHSLTTSTLNALRKGGVIVAFDKVKVEVSGDTAFVSFECAPSIPINFIGVTIHAIPFSGVFTVTV